MRTTRLTTRPIWAVAAASVALVAATSGSARAAILGPYSADANTVHLFHLNEAAGASSAANSGSAATPAISYDGNPYAGDGVDQPTVTTVLGAPGFSGFGNAADLSSGDDVGLGVDFSGNGGVRLDDNAPISTDDRRTDHSSILGVGNAFTLEAMIRLPAIVGTGVNREIIATDGSAGAAGDRGFQFRVNATGLLEFNYIGAGAVAVTAPIPTTGDHAFAANEWFHAAMAFDGTNAQFYWTRVAPQFTAASPLGGPLADTVDSADDMMLIIGNEGRVVGTTGSTESLRGQIDEVRISNVARGAGGFIFGVPEPSSAALALSALALAAWRRRGSARA